MKKYRGGTKLCGHPLSGASCRCPNAAEHLSDGTTVLTLERRDGTTLRCYIDTIEYPLLKQFRWFSVKDERTFYAATLRDKEKQILMHQLLLGKGADHRDHNGLNNRRSNLRVATTEQNGGNRQKDKRRNGTSSLYRGVSFRSGRKFEASIRVNQKLIYLGNFESEVEAALAYDKAAREHFAEYAALNFPQPGEQAAIRGIDDTPEGEEP